MPLFDKILGKTKNENSPNNNSNINSITELIGFLDELLSSDKYIAKSDYLKKIESAKDIVNYFEQLKKDF